MSIASCSSFFLLCGINFQSHFLNWFSVQPSMGLLQNRPWKGQKREHAGEECTKEIKNGSESCAKGQEKRWKVIQSIIVLDDIQWTSRVCGGCCCCWYERIVKCPSSKCGSGLVPIDTISIGDCIHGTSGEGFVCQIFCVFKREVLNGGREFKVCSSEFTIWESLSLRNQISRIVHYCVENSEHPHMLL